MENKSMKKMAKDQIHSYMEWRDMELLHEDTDVEHIIHAGGYKFNAIHMYFTPTNEGVLMESVMPLEVLHFPRMDDLNACISTVNEWQKAWNSGFEFSVRDEIIVVLSCTLPATEEISPRSLVRFRRRVGENRRLMEYFTDAVMPLFYNPAATLDDVLHRLEDALCSKEE